MKKAFFVLNAKAGAGSLKQDWPRLQEKARQFCNQMEFAWTKGPGDGVRLTRKALEAGMDGVFAVGGDGTLNECLNGFLKDDLPLNSKAALGFLHYGRGSDFAKTLSIQKDWLSHLDQVKPKLCKLDCGKATFQTEKGNPQTRYFMNIANVGLAANIVDHAHCGVRIFGSTLNYLLATVRSMAASQPVSVTVVEGSKCYEVELLNGILANGRYFGSGMQPAPLALPDDGFLNWIEIGPVKFLTFLKHISDLYAGRWNVVPEVRTSKITRLEILPKTNHTLRVEMDGDTVGFAPVKFEVLRAVIPFWTPQI